MGTLPIWGLAQLIAEPRLMGGIVVVASTCRLPLHAVAGQTHVSAGMEKNWREEREGLKPTWSV